MALHLLGDISQQTKSKIQINILAIKDMKGEKSAFEFCLRKTEELENLILSWKII